MTWNELKPINRDKRYYTDLGPLRVTLVPLPGKPPRLLPGYEWTLGTTTDPEEFFESEEYITHPTDDPETLQYRVLTFAKDMIATWVREDTP